MASNKSERHHWWPENVSRHWKNDEGGVYWLLPDGSERCSAPNNFGVIGNGHFIKLSDKAGEVTPWDENFESVFQEADNHFPKVIDWLCNLKYESRIGSPRSTRLIPQPVPIEIFENLLNAVVSLAIRSPMTRQAVVALAEKIRGPLPEREKNLLIAINLRDMYQRAINAFGNRGKIAVLQSPDREFIFGDGFFHNLTSASAAPMNPRILVPITPAISVLYAIPFSYSVEPRLCTLVIDSIEARGLNNIVQIYARNAIFYRAEKPEVTENFKSGAHKEIVAFENPVEALVEDLAAL